MKSINPAGWPRPAGFSNGLLSENGVLFVAGQIGMNEKGEIESNFAAQVRTALLNIRTIVEASGGSADRIGRMTWYVTDCQLYRAHVREIGAAYREIIGKHFPAMTIVEIRALLDDRAFVEIEAAAIVL